METTGTTIKKKHESLEEALGVAKALLRHKEEIGGDWKADAFPKATAAQVESLESLAVTPIDPTAELPAGVERRSPIFCTVATAMIEGGVAASSVIGTFVSAAAEHKWNSATVSACSVIDGDDVAIGAGSPKGETLAGSGRQVVYQQHKTLSAAFAKRDVSFERQWSIGGGGESGIAASAWEATTPASDRHQDGFQRATVVVSLLTVSEPAKAETSASKVTWLWCWDFGGPVHEKFIEAERIRVAQRLSKICSMALESCGKQPISPRKEPSSSPTPAASTAIPTKAGSTYRKYLSSVLGGAGGDDGGDDVPLPVAASAPVPVPVPMPAPATSTSTSTVVGCVTCKKSFAGRFCANCGSSLVRCCPSCFTAVTVDSARFCANCGSKLS